MRELKFSQFLENSLKNAKELKQKWKYSLKIENN